MGGWLRELFYYNICAFPQMIRGAGSIKLGAGRNPAAVAYRICGSIFGKLSRMTSPMIFRLRGLILSSVSSFVCQ